MKRYIILLLSLLFIVSNAKISYARHTSTSAGDYAGGMAASRHNLSSSGWPFRNQDTTEICVFCHTPHNANTGPAPLWNKTSATTSFTTYGNGMDDLDWDAKTYVGKTAVGDPGWGSLACLTCHDGVTTFDALINKPGKGIGSPDWLFTMFIPGNLGGPGWWEPWPFLGSLDHFTESLCDSCHTEGGIIEVTWADIGSLVIGADLTDDHPMSIRYRGGSVASLRESSTVIASINMCNQQESGGSCQEELVNGNLWAVAGFINSTATIEDLLRGPSSNLQVECSSCHDPHFKNMTNPETSFFSTYIEPGTLGSKVTNHTDLAIDGLFLRRVGGNSDSGVCRTCHAKADAI